MTEDEKRAMLTFLGTMHAQAKQTDQMIVGQSNFVKPISRSIQQQFTEVLSKPVINNQPNLQHTPQPYSKPDVPIFSEAQNEVVVQQVPSEDQLMFRFDEPAEVVHQAPMTSINSDLIETLKDISLNLQRIGNILEEQNKQNARNKNSKKG